MRIRLLILPLLSLCWACTGDTTEPAPAPAAVDKAPAPAAPERPVEPVEVGEKAFTFKSYAFEAGAAIPKRFTGDGENVSPALAWADPPEGTRSYALIVDDPDAPGEQPFVHWLMWGIPVEIRLLTDATPRDARVGRHASMRQGMNDFGTVGYAGPKPPPGKAHNYRFTLHALSEEISLTAHSSRAELEQAIDGKILATAQFRGTYQR